MHVPSFVVGSLVSGTGYLLIHRELSHRTKSSSQWFLIDYVQKEWSNFYNPNLMKQQEAITSLKFIQSSSTSWNKMFIETWNDSISKIRQAVGSQK
mmetsp:Transcript_7920/g.7523  ORF Transcript_7920/g.7523 Transcript_7920/m.7523 type:complete len:96 (+) Transcript_7920:61-348(+)